MVAIGCASSGVRMTGSHQRSAATGSPPSTAPPASAPGGELPSIAPVAWSGCDDASAPYQCGQITVPLDYGAVTGTQIDIAVIRLPAERPDARIGSLVLNPGGPGGSGLSLVLNEAESFPAAVRERFDIVGFDPRGVGSSTPVRCPLSFDPASPSLGPCINPNVAELPYLGTVNVARDMEMLRRALGDDALTYLGYSYGTIVGAVYADLFPDRVRAMVLDGAVDPDAGTANTSAGGSDFYAEQDFDSTIAAFEDLCNASPACLAGPHTRELIDRVTARIATLGVDAFPDDGRLDAGDIDDLLVNAMYNTADWPLLALALSDADAGDASTLSALYSWLLSGYPADTSTEADETFANIAVRCADFARRGAGSFDCDHFPDTAEALPVVAPVETTTPVLVIGTKDDPATPARYAPRMADALGDAVAVEWEGAGHTATLTSACITDLVAHYLIDLVAPVDGTTCPFVDGASTVAESADAVFADPDPELAAGALADVIQAEGDSPAVATCVATKLVARGDQRLVTYELLGVRSPQLIALRGVLEGSCR
jgi:pimeloyl-ACP methyl ester carboxylesterase